jgi:hypothetical protein
LDAWLDFARGPLFHFCFALLVLGLLRTVYLAVVGVVELCRHRPDKKVTARAYCFDLLRSLFAARTLRRHPLQGVVSMVFHTGLLMVSLLLAAHVLLWKRAVGFAWPSLPEEATRGAALAVILAGIATFAIRLTDGEYRARHSRQETLWPLLILVPVVTGYICANYSLAPSAYQGLMLLHVCSANLVMALIPFTKIAQAVLAPFARYAPHIHLETAPVAGRQSEKRLVWVLHTPEEEVTLVGGKRFN